jgi:hypothetical protein
MAYMFPYAGADAKHIRKLRSTPLPKPPKTPKTPKAEPLAPIVVAPEQFTDIDIPPITSHMRRILFDTCVKYDVHPNAVVGTTRSVKITMARWEYCYRCHRELGKAYAHIGRTINKDHASVRYACAMYERQRVPFGYDKPIEIKSPEAAAGGSGE